MRRWEGFIFQSVGSELTRHCCAQISFNASLDNDVQYKSKKLFNARNNTLGSFAVYTYNAVITHICVLSYYVIVNTVQPSKLHRFLPHEAALYLMILHQIKIH